MIDLIITFGSFGLDPDLKLASRTDPDLKPFRIRYTVLEGKAIETTFLSKKGSCSFSFTLILKSANVPVFDIGSRHSMKFLDNIYGCRADIRRLQ
jgi:hypothetical protein